MTRTAGLDRQPLGGVRALFGAAHLAPSLAMTGLFTGMAVTTGRDAPGVLVVASAVLTGQLSIGWLNDLCDAERDRRVGRTDKPLASGEVSARAVRLAAIGAGLACIPLSLASGLLAGTAHLIAVAAGWPTTCG